MTIRITCSQCARKYKFKDEAAGKKSKCHCGAVIRIPKKSESPSPVVVEQEQSEVDKPATPKVPPPKPKLPGPLPNHSQNPEGFENCKKCGKQSTKGSRFCQWCGASLSGPIIQVKRAYPGRNA